MKCVRAELRSPSSDVAVGLQVSFLVVVIQTTRDALSTLETQRLAPAAFDLIQG